MGHDEFINAAYSRGFDVEQAIPIIFVLLIVGGIAWAFYADKKRTEEIKQMADDLGYVYRENPRQHLPGSLWQLSLFNKGRSRRSRNLIQKETEGVSVSVMEHSYSTGSGKNRRTYSQTIVVIESPKMSLPQFDLSPENFLHKIGRAIGFQDINFDSHPDFSKRYRLVGQNELQIRECFHEGVLEFIESQDKICMEGDRSLFICYHANKTKAPQYWRHLIATGFKAYEQLC